VYLPAESTGARRHSGVFIPVRIAALPIRMTPGASPYMINNKKGAYCEENLSTIQYATHPHPWFSRADGDCRRAQNRGGAQAPRPQMPDRV